MPRALKVKRLQGQTVRGPNRGRNRGKRVRKNSGGRKEDREYKLERKHQRSTRTQTIGREGV